jgi:hypothetical protein
MNAEEFMRAALAAGAQVEFDDGKLIVKRSEVEPESYPEPNPASLKRFALNVPPKSGSKSAGALRTYQEYKRELGIAHVSHLVAAITILIGVRSGNWTSGREEIIRFAKKNVDLPTMRECVSVATAAKHAVKIQNKPVSISSSALVAAIYSRMEADPALTLGRAKEILEAPVFVRVAHRLATEVLPIGGVRSIEARKLSYARFTNMLIGTEE